jgi:hypothetical protein
MGSANYSKEQAQALANKVIAVAEARKDAVAFISPYRQAFLNDSSVGTVTVNDIDTITDNVVGFYALLLQRLMEYLIVVTSICTTASMILSDMSL